LPLAQTDRFITTVNNTKISGVRWILSDVSSAKISLIRLFQAIFSIYLWRQFWQRAFVHLRCSKETRLLRETDLEHSPKDNSDFETTKSDVKYCFYS